MALYSLFYTLLSPAVTGSVGHRSPASVSNKQSKFEADIISS